MKRAALVLAAVLAASVLPAAESATGQRQLRVGLVLQSTAFNDPYESGAFAGFRRAVQELGVKGRVVSANPKAGPLPSILYLARQKYDLVIGIGFLEVGAVDAAARKFPGTKFAIIDSSLKDLPHRPKNVQGGVFAAEQAGYLAGYLAALMEKRRPGKDVIGSVAGYKLPTVDSYIAGYQAGAGKADPGIATLNGYSKNFTNPAKCKPVALDQIAKGAGVIFQVASACGDGALQIAKEQGVWGIGVDSDESSLGSHILTSAMKRLDVAVFNTVKALRQGTFRTGTDTVFNLRNGGVGLGKISPKVPRAFVQKVEAIRKQIIAGKIKVPSTLAQR
jgi:basic membrane protein A and related proteins